MIYCPLGAQIMAEEKEQYKVNNVVKKKTELSLLASRLKDVFRELDKLSEEEKKVGIEKDKLSIKVLYDALNNYIGC
ncbi:hypothetical protein SAMN02194393_05164 [Maledivibacter halophilus]|uniref:Uncharacterized protein n=2 Tax=Maledivibacter halophilus TaxID=36842 RepID=A0A1T5MQF6_9FIRM|nr:hypothetical protein SAMN02194393_05164 [Maledivibacter halophilus]